MDMDFVGTFELEYGRMVDFSRIIDMKKYILFNPFLSFAQIKVNIEMFGYVMVLIITLIY